MSLGYGGVARLVLDDGESAIYAYKCTNLSKRGDDPREDGEIYIELRPIASAYVPKKTKRHPDGVPVRSAENVDYEKMVAAGSLRTTNCSNASCLGDGGIDAQAWGSFARLPCESSWTGPFPRRPGTSSKVLAGEHGSTRAC